MLVNDPVPPWPWRYLRRPSTSLAADGAVVGGGRDRVVAERGTSSWENWAQEPRIRGPDRLTTQAGMPRTL